MVVEMKRILIMWMGTLWEADDDDKGNVVDDDVDDDTDADNCVDDEDTCEEAGKSNNQFVSVCRGVALCDRGPDWWIIRVSISLVH